MAKEKEKTAPEEELLVLHEKWVKAAREHLREIIIAAVILVVVAALWSGIRYYFQNKENKASLLYAHAIMSKDKAQQESLFQEIIKRYGGTTAALEAHLSLYEIYLEKDNPQAAQKELKYLLKKAKEPWKAFLELGLGYFKEDEKKFAEAEKKYLKALEAKIGLDSLVYLDLARVAELKGDYLKATEYYQKFVASNPEGDILDFVQVKLAKLMTLVSQKQKESS